VVAPFFFVGGPGYHSTRSFQAVWDLGHIVIFTLITLVIVTYQSRSESIFGGRLFWIKIFLLVLLLGLGVELCQTAVNGRGSDVADLLRNQLGCMFGYYFYSFKNKPISRLWDNTRHIVAACCFCFAIFPLFIALGDEVLAYYQFPVLSNFESVWEKRRWVDQRQLSIDHDIKTNGDHSLRIRLSTATYSGASLFHFPNKWIGYQWIYFSVFNPNSGMLTLHVRIHDEEHKFHNNEFLDRYYHTFQLNPGWNKLRISLEDVENAPKSRKMNMDAIEQVGFFVMNLPRPQSIYLDNLYLAK
ncbi:MAG: VanZ family protein, partial [Desulfobulbaceae bacterium]|nr:VanZ family protein [Desulfobulbaceae bacterium]